MLGGWPPGQATQLQVLSSPGVCHISGMWQASGSEWLPTLGLWCCAREGAPHTRPPGWTELPSPPREPPSRMLTGTGPGKEVAHSAFPLRSLKFYCHDLIYDFFFFFYLRKRQGPLCCGFVFCPVAQTSQRGWALPFLGGQALPPHATHSASWPPSRSSISIFIFCCFPHDINY